MAEERFEEPSRVHTLRAVMPVAVREDLAVELPVVIRWALSLNEGSLLTAELEDWGEAVRYSFRNYERATRILGEACADPWPYIEPLLNLPMGRILTQGALELPERVAERLRLKSGDRLVLRAQVSPAGQWLTLEPFREGQAVPELYAEASYTLRVEPDSMVRPPPDALRLLPSSSPEQLRVPDFLEDCAWVRLSVRLSEKGVVLHWDAYAEQAASPTSIHLARK